MGKSDSEFDKKIQKKLDLGLPSRKAEIVGANVCYLPLSVSNKEQKFNSREQIMELKNFRNKKQKSTKRKEQSYKLNILYYNCQGLATEERLYELEKALENVKWDILGISEVRRVGENLIKRTNGNIFYYYGKTKGFRGVGFYVNEKWRSSIIELKSINERLAVLKMKINKSIPRTCIQVYG